VDVQFPVVMRRIDSGYALIGECFGLSLMDGKLSRMTVRDDF
jgi:hypothetical protein